MKVTPYKLHTILKQALRTDLKDLDEKTIDNIASNTINALSSGALDSILFKESTDAYSESEAQLDFESWLDNHINLDGVETGECSALYDSLVSFFEVDSFSDRETYEIIKALTSTSFVEWFDLYLLLKENFKLKTKDAKPTVFKKMQYSPVLEPMEKS